MSVPDNPVYYDTNDIPRDFDAATYLISNRDGLRISDINQRIRDHMLAHGWDPKDLVRAGSSREMFMATIDKDVHVHGRPSELEFCLAFDDATYVIHDGNMVAGDDVMIRTAIAGGTHVIATVTSVVHKSNTCIVRVSNMDQARFFEEPSRLHLRMHGQRLYDIKRLASINYVRGYRSLVGSVMDPSRDREFNAEFYRTLYPETRCLDDYAAYLDYSKHMNDGNPRVGKASQLALDQTLDSDHVHIMNDKIAWSSNMLASHARASFWNSNAAMRASHAATWSSNQIGTSCVHARDMSNLGSIRVHDRATIGSKDGEGIALTVLGSMKADDYLVTSDARAKHHINPLMCDWCLTHTVAMCPLQYELKGCSNANANGVSRYGFLAQDMLRDLGGSVVRESAGYLPSALVSVRVDRFGRVTSPELFEKLPDLRVGDMLRIVYDAREYEVDVRVVYRDHSTMIVTNPPVQNIYDSDIFVYGHKVPDMLSIDHMQIIPLLVGSIQALAKRLDKLQRLV